MDFWMNNYIQGAFRQYLNDKLKTQNIQSLKSWRMTIDYQYALKSHKLFLVYILDVSSIFVKHAFS